MDETRRVTIVGAKAAIDAGKRLTIPQGKHLYRQYEEAMQTIERLRAVRDLKHRQLADALTDIAIEQAHYQRLATDWNALCNMLDVVLSVRMYGDENGAWHVTDLLAPGTEIQEKSVVSAFEAVLKLRLAEKDEAK